MITGVVVLGNPISLIVEFILVVSRGRHGSVDIEQEGVGYSLETLLLLSNPMTSREDPL